MNHREYFRGKKIVIAGGGGFVGSHISDVLGGASCEVFIPRTKDGIDFRKYDDCLQYLHKTKPDVLINCAANQGGIGYHKGRQAELFADNMRMGMFLMQAAQAAGVGKFVNVVAGCAYPGYLEKDELNEEDFWSGPPHESIFSYGFPRRASVVFGQALKRQHDFPSIHLILANMYGPREHFHPDQSKALAALIKKFYEAKRDAVSRVEVWGTGKPVRDWLYVKDGVEGILRATVAYDDIEPMNIATGVGISIGDLARTIKKVVGYDGELDFDTSKPDGALKKTFGVHKMEKVLGWLPATPLEDGIRETLEWFDAHYAEAIAH